MVILKVMGMQIVIMGVEETSFNWGYDFVKNVTCNQTSTLLANYVKFQEQSDGNIEYEFW